MAKDCRTCRGCGEIKKIAGTRGPRNAKRRLCEECLAKHDAGEQTPIDLLAKVLPIVAAADPDLAETIRETLEPLAIA